MQMDASDIISICAAVIAVISAVDTHFQSKKINNINLQSRYFDDIYKDYLIYKIPEARKYIQFLNCKLDGTDKLINVLNEIRSDSLYFYYNNKTFYKELKKRLQCLEDFLCSNTGKEFDVDEQMEILKEIQTKLEDIYQYINVFYLEGQV